MEQIHDRVAGLDVHRDQVAVCVRTPGPRGGVQTEKARFDTTTGGLAALAEWLAGHAVALVAMEATGVYWKPVYYALEGRFDGVAVQRASRQERPGPQDRHVRRRVAGRRGRARDGAAQLRAAAADPGAAGADALPQDPDRRPGGRDRPAGEGAPGRRDQAHLGGLQGADPVGAGDDRGADRRRARPGGAGRAGQGQAAPEDPAADRGPARPFRRPSRHRRGPHPGPSGLPGRDDRARWTRRSPPASPSATSQPPGCWPTFPGWSGGASR